MTFKQICPHCKDEIPANHVQQGGLHIGCYESEIDVYFISLPHAPDYGFFEVDIEQVREVILNIEEPHLISKKKMSAGRYYNAPEFGGF